MIQGELLAHLEPRGCGRSSNANHEQHEDGPVVTSLQKVSLVTSGPQAHNGSLPSTSVGIMFIRVRDKCTEWHCTSTTNPYTFADSVRNYTVVPDFAQ